MVKTKADSQRVKRTAILSGQFGTGFALVKEKKEDIMGYYEVYVDGERFVAVSFSTYKELNAEPSECVKSGAVVMVPEKYVVKNEN